MLGEQAERRGCRRPFLFQRCPQEVLKQGPEREPALWGTPVTAVSPVKTES